MDADEKSIQIVNMCLAHSKNICKKVHDFVFTASQIKSVSLYKRDDRCAYLYVHHNSDDFQIYFPSTECRQKFYDLISELASDQEVFVNLSIAETQIQVNLITFLMLKTRSSTKKNVFCSMSMISTNKTKKLCSEEEHMALYMQPGTSKLKSESLSKKFQKKTLKTFNLYMKK